MGSIQPVQPTYTPNLPAEVIKDGLLSDAQLEAVVYAGQAHEQLLPNGQRRGFFIGDGTGVGKGREISGIILDNWRQGRKKAVWVSFNKGLLTDAQRDFGGVGGDKNLLFFQGKTKPSDALKPKEGILFTSYSTLKEVQRKQVSKVGDAPAKSRLQQIVDWLGPDFDGVIVFDAMSAPTIVQDAKVETPDVDVDFSLVMHPMGGGFHAQSPLQLSLASNAPSDLTVSMAGVPSGWAEGYTFFSLSTQGPKGFGNIFGVERDFLVDAALNDPALPGGVLHFTNTGAGSYPYAAFTFPPALIQSLAGLQLDAVVMLVAGNGAVVEVSNVARVTLQ